MEDNINEVFIGFSQVLYEKNIQENDFSNKETDGIGDDVDGNS